MKKLKNQVQSELEKQMNQFQNEIEKASQFIKTSNTISEDLETTPRFLKDAIRGAGYKFDGCMAEFCDNSMDAGAKNIFITPIEKENGTFNIIITDDGIGIPPTKIYDTVKKIGYGYLEDYSSMAISNFGLGMKFAIINLCKRGMAIIESVYGKKKSTVYLSVDGISGDGIPCVFEPIVEDTSEKQGTKIFIPNVRTSNNQISSLIKFLGCTYYPHIENGNKLNISVFHKEEYKEVKFFDPLYRNIKQGTQSNNADCEINGFKIFIRGMTYDFSFPVDKISPWDIKQGSSGFANSRSGIYFRLGGRYITLGEGLFHSQKSAKSQQWRRAHIRIEVEFDRELIPILGIGFNKSLVNFDETDPELKPFMDELNPIVKWANKIVMAIRKDDDLSPEETKQKDEVEANVNSRVRKHPLDRESLPETKFPKPDKKELEEKESEEDKEKIKKIRPEGLTYNKQGVILYFKSLGEFVPAFNFDRVNKKLIITFNTDHNYYKYYATLPTIGQEVCVMLIISIIDAIAMTKLEMDSDNWDNDLLQYLSTRLNKYLKI